jgi:hypothetical protein
VVPAVIWGEGSRYLKLGAQGETSLLALHFYTSNSHRMLPHYTHVLPALKSNQADSTRASGAFIYKLYKHNTLIHRQKAQKLCGLERINAG